MNNNVLSCWWEDDTFFVEFEDGQVIGYENAYISSFTHSNLDEDNDFLQVEELPVVASNLSAETSWIEQVYKK